MHPTAYETSAPSSRIIRADRKDKILGVVMIGIIFVLEFLLVVVLQDFFDKVKDLSLTQPEAAILRALPIYISLVLGMTAFCLYFGLRFFFLGRNILESNQVPPPGTRVIMDVHVITGPTAIRLGYFSKALGYLLVLAAFLLATMPVRPDQLIPH